MKNDSNICKKLKNNFLTFSIEKKYLDGEEKKIKELREYTHKNKYEMR